MTGRKITEVDVGQFHRLAAAYAAVALGLGTGDGRSGVRAARRRLPVRCIGLDVDPTGMRRASGHAPANGIFVVAAATLLSELDGTVSELTVRFPWDSLLRFLWGAWSPLAGDPSVWT